MKRRHDKLMIHMWLLCIAIFGTFIIGQSATHAGTWQSLPPLGTARNQFAGGVIDGKIFVFGGNRKEVPDNLKSTEMFDPTLGSWGYKADNNNCPYGIEQVSGAVVNGKFYVFGDYDGSCISSVEEYNPTTDVWTSMAPIPTPRSGATAVAYKNKIYLFGAGFLGIDVVEVYNPANNTWESVTYVPKTEGGYVWGDYAVAIIADKAYLIGGVAWSESHQTVAWIDRVAVYDFITGSWTTNGLAPLPTHRVFSYNSAAPVVDGKIYLIGGVGEMLPPSNYGPSDKFDIYDTVTNSWVAGVPLPTPTEGHLAVVVKDEIYIVGGDDSNGRTGAVWKYNLGLGDLNGDGSVDAQDLEMFALEYGWSACDALDPCQGDFDRDGQVDGVDLARLALQFGRTN